MDGDLDEVVTALSQEFQAEQLAALAGETVVRSRPKPWLETLRLAMREFVPDDFDDLYRLDRDPRVMKYITGKPATREETQATVRRITRYYRLYPDLGAWYTVRRDTGKFIGWFSLKYAGKSPDIEIGYRLLPEAWGQGFATEGATAMHRLRLRRSRPPSHHRRHAIPATARRSACS